MLLQQLTEVLEAVKDKIANQHDFFTNNELQTRVTLIDPALKRWVGTPWIQPGSE